MSRRTLFGIFLGLVLILGLLFYLPKEPNLSFINVTFVSDIQLNENSEDNNGYMGNVIIKLELKLSLLSIKEKNPLFHIDLFFHPREIPELSLSIGSFQYQYNSSSLWIKRVRFQISITDSLKLLANNFGWFEINIGLIGESGIITEINDLFWWKSPFASSIGSEYKPTLPRRK